MTKLQEAQARRNAASKEIGKAKAAKDEAARRSADGRGGGAQGRHPGGRGRGAQARRGAATRRCPSFPTCRSTRCRTARTRRTTRRCARSASRRSSRINQAEAALRDRRGAGADGLRDGGEDFRRAVRGAEGRAGAAGAGARRVHARPAHRPRTACGYTENSRRSWSTTKPRTAPATFRSLRRICSYPGVRASRASRMRNADCEGYAEVRRTLVGEEPRALAKSSGKAQGSNAA